MNARWRFHAALIARLDDAVGSPATFKAELRYHLDQAIEMITVVASKGNEALCRQATSVLYHAITAVLLAWEGGQIHEKRGGA